MVRTGSPQNPLYIVLFFAQKKRQMHHTPVNFSRFFMHSLARRPPSDWFSAEFGCELGKLAFRQLKVLAGERLLPESRHELLVALPGFVLVDQAGQ